jgi:hypothetical protein
MQIEPNKNRGSRTRDFVSEAAQKKHRPGTGRIDDEDHRDSIQMLRSSGDPRGTGSHSRGQRGEEEEKKDLSAPEAVSRFRNLS